MLNKLAVLGAGGIGGVIGGYLARGGRDVTLIDTWPANVERIKADGLTVTAIDEEFTVRPQALHLGEVSAARRAFDAVFLAVKSYDTGWASLFLEPYLAPGGFVVSTQNSINEEVIAAQVGWPRVVGCVVTLGAAMYEPGHVERTSVNESPAFTLGEPSGMVTPRLQEMATILEDGGVTRTTTNLWGQRWAKLATNSMANAPAGLTGLKSAELRQHPQTRRLGVRIAAELVQVAEALGVRVEPIGGAPAAMYRDALGDGAVMEELTSRMLEHGATIGEGRPSLAQDVMKGRRTEVEYLNGYVVRKGEEVGIATPVNKAVLELTKRLEAGELEQGMANVDSIGE